jgi:hypothetical protein
VTAALGGKYALDSEIDRYRSRRFSSARWSGRWVSTTIEGDELHAVMDVVYTQSRNALGKQRKDVLRLAGL